MGKTIGVVLSLKDKCSPVITTIAQKFGMTTKEAQKLNAELGRQAKVIDGTLTGALQVGGAVMGATIGVVTALTGKTMAYGDKVDKLSQKIGMSRKAYQEWDYIMSQNGGNVDSLQMGYKTLTQQMAGVQNGSKESISAFRKLGVSVKDSSGHLRSQEDVFNDSVKALQRIKNPTEKAILAQKLFGKAAIEMKPLLNQSAESVENLRQKANALGFVMADDAVDGAVKLTDTMDTVKRSFGAIGLSIGVGLVPIVQQLANQLLNNLPQIQSALIPAINAFGDTIGFVCGHLDVIIPAVTSLVGVFGALTIVPKIAGFVAAFCNPVGLAVVAIGTLISAIGVARAKGIGFGTALKEIFKTISGGVGAVLKLVGAVMGLGNALKGTDKAKVSTSTIPKHALGTSFARGGTALVGEYGPELVNLPRGASVINARNTAKVFADEQIHSARPAHTTHSGTQSNNKIEINLNVAGNVVGNREFMNEMLNLMAIELRKVMPA